MRRSPLSHTLVAAAAVLALSVAGCSDDDGEATPDTTPSTAPEGSSGGAADTGSGDGSSSESESSDNPTTFGYRVDGEPGTTVLVETLAETEAGPQELTQTWSITDRPRWMLYSDWVTGGEISLELTEGDAATVEILRGHAVDPDNPSAGIEVVETLDTVEVAAGEPTAVTFP